jgi:hypothetical protein
MPILSQKPLQLLEFATFEIASDNRIHSANPPTYFYLCKRFDELVAAGRPIV